MQNIQFIVIENWIEKWKLFLISLVLWCIFIGVQVDTSAWIRVQCDCMNNIPAVAIVLKWNSFLFVNLFK